MKKSCIGIPILGLFLLVNTLNAQISFEKVFSGGPNFDRAYSVEQTTDGGYIVAGSADIGSGSESAYLIKTDIYGDTLWTKKIKVMTNSINRGSCVRQTTDGGYIFVGRTDSISSFNTGDVFLIKTDLGGNVQWTKTYGDTLWDEGTSVKQTNDGGYIIAGLANADFLLSIGDVLLTKTDSVGQIVWTKTYGGTNIDAAGSVEGTTDGGYIVAGTTYSFGAGSNPNIYIIKTNSSGDTTWTKTYGGFGYDEGDEIHQTIDGGYILVGSTNNIGAGDKDIYLLKLNSNGDTVWTKTLGGITADYGHSVQLTSDGGFIVAGSYSDGSYPYSILGKADSLGTFTWSQINPRSSIAYSVQQTTDGGYVFAGGIEDSTFDNNVYLVKTNSSGIITWDNTINNSTSNFIQIFPNPSNGSFEVKWEKHFSEKIKIEIVNIFGQKIFEDFSLENNSINISLNEISSGIYFCKLTSSNVNIAVRKLFVNH